jgi:D-glycero-alpha-D-manno-heptose 1-phosphate guanylyltransferase
MAQEAIILAGGLGTRLKSVVADLPKSLAPVNGKPFLEYLLSYAKQQGIEKFIFALGYKTTIIEAFVKSYLPEGSYVFSIENEPLGTGGAIYQACSLTTCENVIVLNADTFFGVNFCKMILLHNESGAECTLALKPMQSFSRYGAVEINGNKQVVGFKEKKFYENGLINGGVYVLSPESFLRKDFPSIFSFENDYLEKYYTEKNIYGMVSDAYFIDIGIPEDFLRVQTEISRHI